MDTLFSIEVIQLTRPERREARTHWLALMFAPSPHHLEEARIALRATPHLIRKAVTTAIVECWRTGLPIDPDRTPFEEMN